jgi:serine/threonine protein kinase
MAGKFKLGIDISNTPKTTNVPKIGLTMGLSGSQSQPVRKTEEQKVCETYVSNVTKFKKDLPLPDNLCKYTIRENDECVTHNEEIGKGAFGSAYISKDTENTKYVVKDSLFLREKDCNRLNFRKIRQLYGDYEKEIESIRSMAKYNVIFPHNIIKIYKPLDCIKEDGENPSRTIIMDRVTNVIKIPALFEMLKKEKETNIEKILNDIIMQIAYVTLYINSHKIVHNDISFDNVLISYTKDPIEIDYNGLAHNGKNLNVKLKNVNYVVKFIDYSISKQYDDIVRPYDLIYLFVIITQFLRVSHSPLDKFFSHLSNLYGKEIETIVNTITDGAYDFTVNEMYTNHLASFENDAILKEYATLTELFFTYNEKYPNVTISNTEDIIDHSSALKKWDFETKELISVDDPKCKKSEQSGGNNANNYKYNKYLNNKQDYLRLKN